MTEVRWTRQTADDVPPGLGWLGGLERRQRPDVRAHKRERDWLLGRWTAKRLLDDLGYRGAQVIRADDGGPVAVVNGEVLPLVLSISHRADCSIAAIASTPGMAVGCDIELVEPRRDVFVRDYFTAGERARVDTAGEPRQRDRVVTLIWSAKESALKVLRTGLGRDTRTVDVRLGEATDGVWAPLAVRDAVADTVFTGYWRVLGDLVATFVTDTPCPAPREIAHLRS